MADFLKAYKRLGPNEGGYANHPSDKGGETWKGIARNYHPTWLGWALVDGYKGQANFPKVLYSSPELESMVVDFYYKNFWNVCGLDKVESQWVAENTFDASVHHGTYAGALFLQRAANMLGANLTADGKIGPLTIKAANSLNEAELVKRYVDLREDFIRGIVQRNKSQIVFYAGWIARCLGMREKVG